MPACQSILPQKTGAMSTHFPLNYTLDNGTDVLVRQDGGGRYHFTLTDADGRSRQFTYVDGKRTKAEWDDTTDFEQLEALRRFWLETEDVV